MTRKEPLDLQVRELELKVVKIKQKVAVLESLANDIISILAPISGREGMKKLVEYKKILRR